MLAMTLRSAWATRRRLVGTGLAVLLGVAFLTGTLVLGDTLRANFDSLFTEVTAGTDVVVRNPRELSRGDAMAEEGSFVDAALVDQVAGVDGVDRAVPQVSGYGALIGTDGEAVGGNGPPRLAGNWVDDPDLNPYRLVDGRAPEADDEVVVNRGALDASGYHLGDRVTVQMPQPVEVTVVGVSEFGDQEGLGDVTFTAFTLDAAERYIAGGTGRVTAVLAKAERRRVAGRARHPGARRRPRRRRGAHGRPGHRRAAQRHRGRLPRDDDHVPHASSPGSPCWWRRSASTTRSRSSWPSGPGRWRCSGPWAPPAARCW